MHVSSGRVVLSSENVKCHGGFTVGVGPPPPHQFCRLLKFRP